MDSSSVENRYETFRQLREQYPEISYLGHELSEDEDGARVVYSFVMGDEIRFAPSIAIPRPRDGWHVPLDHPFTRRGIYLLGLVELISYWKAACPPRIRVAGPLDEWEQAWWTHLIRNGMGEFLFRNGIPLDEPELVTFEPTSVESSAAVPVPGLDGNMIPVGGGKDSSVALRLLDGDRAANKVFLLNPTPAATKVTAAAGYVADDTIIVKRRLDPLLLELNARGFLNGHTPFSAMLGFLSVLVAGLHGKRYVILANESSANESTVIGLAVNHQYSKSVEFEDAFREYIARTLTPDVEYFSLLRPLNEVRIGQLFGRLAGPLTDVFCSCNVGGRAGYWCGDCEKCLFAFLTLSPFVPHEDLVRVFGSDLLDRPELLPGLERLLGVTDVKPFDCVGTIDEVRTLVQHLAHGDGVPRQLLLAALAKHGEVIADAIPLAQFLAEHNEHHNVPPRFAPLVSP